MWQRRKQAVFGIINVGRRFVEEFEEKPKSIKATCSMGIYIFSWKKLKNTFWRMTRPDFKKRFREEYPSKDALCGRKLCHNVSRAIEMWVLLKAMGCQYG
jgi:ADP-glucose pyrophosphorylase